MSARQRPEFQKIPIREVGSRSKSALAARLFGKSWPARIGQIQI